MRKRLNKKQIKALLYSLFDYQRFIGNKHLNNAILQALQEDEKLEDMELDAVAGGTTSDKQINHLEGWANPFHRADGFFHYEKVS